MGNLANEILGSTPLQKTIIGKLPQQKLQEPFPETLEKQDNRVSQEPQNPISDFVSGHDSTGLLNLQLRRAQEIEEQEANRIVRTQIQTGLAPDFVERNLEFLEGELRKVENEKLFDPLELIKTSPIFANWIKQHPAYAKIALKDIPNLPNLEQLARRPKSQWPFPDSHLEKMAERLADIEVNKPAELDPVTKGISSLFPKVERTPERQKEFDEIVARQRKASRERIRKRILGELKSEEAFIKGEGPVGLFETFSIRYRENPSFLIPFLSGTRDLIRITELYEAAKAMENRTATQEQVDFLVRFGRLEEAKARRGTTILGDVAGIISELPAFVGEFATTSGVYTGVKGIFLKTGKELAEDLVKRSVMKAISKGVGVRVLAATAQTAVASPVRIISGTIERMTPRGTVDVGNNTIAFNIIPGTGEPFNVALHKSIVDAFAEIASERTGALFTILDKPLNKVLFSWWLGKNPGRVASAFQRALQRGGVHGIIGEMGEERIGELIKAVGTARAPEIPTPRQLLVEAIAFLPGAALISIGGGAAPKIERKTTPKTNPAFFKELGDLVRETDMIKNHPTVVEELIEESHKDTETEFIYIPLEVWNERALSQLDNAGNPVDPRAWAKEVTGSEKVYDEAIKNKTDLQIKTSKYAVNISHTDHNAFFQEEARNDPLEQNERETNEENEAVERAQKSIEQIQERIQAEKADPSAIVPTEGAGVSSEIAPDPKGVIRPKPSFTDVGFTRVGSEIVRAKPQELSESESSSQKVFETIRDGLASLQLKKIEGLKNFTGSDIERIASVFASRFATRAEILRVDPFELFRFENLKIRKVKTAEEALIDQDTPEARERLVRVFFQAEKRRGVKRGVSIFRPGGIDIVLLEQANRSTLFHEMGHVWLDELGRDVEALERRDPEQLTDRQRQLLDDGEAALEWLNVKSFKEITSKHHDQWAVGVEAYFFEGKAPNSRLRQAFHNFKKWLVKIYRDMVNLKVTLTDDIRDVMSRLIASEDEIAIAKSRQSIDALFGLDPKNSVGMTDQQAANYTRQKEKSARVSEEKFIKEFTENIRRRESKAWREEFQKVREEVRNDLSQRQGFIALSVLSTGLLPNGTQPVLPNERIPSKLNRQAIIEQYGKERLALLPKSIFAKEGILSDLAAEDFGFATGNDLLNELERIFRNEKETSPLFSQLVKLEKEIAALEKQNTFLKDIKEAKRGLKVVPGAAKKIETALRQDILSETNFTEIQNQHKDIQARGGVQVPNPESIPEEFRVDPKAKKKLGIPLNEFVDELFNQNLIEELDPDQAFQWLRTSSEGLKAIQQRLQDLPKEAKRIARQQIDENIKALLEGTKQLEFLRGQLRKVQKEQRLIENSISRKGEIENIIDRITEETMAERHPDRSESEEELDREAMSLAHNEESAKLLEMEIKWMASNRFSTFRALARKITASPKTVQQYKVEAQEEIALKTLREIKPRLYQRAIKEQGNIARDTFFRGDVQSAVEAKELQLRNHELFREATKAVALGNQITKLMAKFSKKSKRESLAKTGFTYLDQIDAIRDRFEFAKISAATLEKRISLRDFAEEHFKEQGIWPNIPEQLLNEANKNNYRDIPIQELIDIQNTVKNIDKLASLKNKLVAIKDRRTLEEIKEVSLKSIQDNSKGTRKVQLGQGEPLREALRVGASVLAMNTKFSSLIRQLDGFKDNGALWNFIIRPLNTAANRETEMNKQAAQKLDVIFKRYTVKDWATMYIKTLRVESLKHSFSRKDAIMVALNSGNSDSFQKLKDGLTNSFKREDNPVTDQHIFDIIDTLDKRDMEFVQEIWDYIDTFWEETKALSERIDGIAPEKVEALPLSTKHGTFRGGYFPLEYDERQSFRKAKELVKEAGDRALKGFNFRATTRHGHRKARIEGVRRPLKLSFNVIFKHVANVIHDQTHYEALIDVNRILGDFEIKKTINDHYGDLFVTELSKAVDAIAGGRTDEINAYERVAAVLRRGATIAILGFKMTTALIQPLGLTSSWVRLGPRFMLRGLSRFLGNPLKMSQTVKWIKEKSSFMRNRGITQIREIDEVRSRLGLKGRAFTKFEGAALWLTVKMQAWADHPTWIGGYEKAMEQLKPEGAISEQQLKEIEQKAVELADQTVVDSQGGGHIKDLSRIQREKGILSLFTMFSTYFNARWNLARESIGRTSFKSPFEVGRLMVDMITLYWVPAVLSVMAVELLRGRVDEDEEDQKDFIDRLMLDAALEPLQDVIGVREIVGPLKGFNYKGPAGLKLFGEVGDFAKQWGQDEMDEGFWRELNDVAGPLFHYPSEQIEATLEGFNAWLEGEAGIGAILLGEPAKRR